MPSYRFCRPDDIPFLVRAVNECFDVHFPERPALSVGGFREEMKELDLWPSNSMVAAEEDLPMAVLTATKREDEVLISRIGVRPGAELEGHGGHLLTSLGQKLAVLGPPRLAAEVPGALPGALAFFRAVGWRDEAVYTDLEREPGAPEVDAVPEGLVARVGVADLDDLEGTGALAVSSDDPDGGDEQEVKAWERRVESLRGRSETLHGAALASPDRVEGWVLWEEADEALEVAAWGVAEPERRTRVLSLLLRWLVGTAPGHTLRLAKTGDDEIPAEVTAALGLHAGQRYHRFTTEAKPL